MDILANRGLFQLLFLTFPKAYLWSRGLAFNLRRLSDMSGEMLASAVASFRLGEHGVIQFIAPAFGTIPFSIPENHRT